MVIEYCSYKGLTQNNLDKCLRMIQKIEYCSYKGLTLYIHHFSHPTISIEYCSYKGLTLKLISKQNTRFN